jgi:hypothetical protein
MREVWESSKGKIIALELSVCLLLQACLVQLKHAYAKKQLTLSFLALWATALKYFKRCRLQRKKILSAVGYSVKKDFQKWHFFRDIGYNA